MPSTDLSEESVLLRPHGWRMTKNLPTECQILGIDRHGKVVETTAQLLRTGKRSRLAYVGTGAAVAALVADTRLIANDGKKSRASDIVEGTNHSRLQFETLVRIPDLEPKLAIEDLWTCLSDAAAFKSSELIALRCRDSITDIGIRPLFPLKQYSGQSFLILTRHELATALSADWSGTIVGLITCWLRNREEDRVEVERSAYSLALWFGMALLSSGSGYAFHFDSIQHSSYVFVSVKLNPPRPIQPLAVAFYAPCETDSISLIWNDHSVAPITGGFLLASG